MDPACPPIWPASVLSLEPELCSPVSPVSRVMWHIPGLQDSALCFPPLLPASALLAATCSLIVGTGHPEPLETSTWKPTGLVWPPFSASPCSMLPLGGFT